MKNYISENTINGNIPTITENTTLAELIDILGSVTRAAKTPTSRKLREEAGEPIAESDGILVYSNGYGVYDNGSGRTVMWIPSCVSFTYYFDPMKESEKGGEIKEHIDLPEGFLESQPWMLALTLIGDHRVEMNMMNRTGSRTGTRDYDSDDNGDKDGDAEDAVEKSYQNEYKPELLSENVNAWFGDRDQSYMIRSMDYGKLLIFELDEPVITKTVEQVIVPDEPDENEEVSRARIWCGSSFRAAAGRRN